MYIIATIILWSLSTLILLAGSKYKSLRWICLLGYIVGGGILGKFMSDMTFTNTLVAYINKVLYQFFLSISFNFAPYLLLIFSISYAGQFSSSYPVNTLLAKFLLLVPPVTTIILYGFSISAYKCRLLLIFWVTPYFFCSDYILLKSLLSEKNPSVKRQKLSTCVTVSAATIYGFISCHLIPVLKIKLSIERDIFATIALYIIFIILSSRYGILGVKLKFERYNPFSSILTLSSGTLILSHTLKNEMNKISMCAENIKKYSGKNASVIDRNMDIILISSQYVLQMVKKLQSQADDIVLQKKPSNIASVIDKCLEMIKPYTELYKIDIFTDYCNDTDIIIDNEHIQETFINIYMNSIEATEPGGSITTRVYRYGGFLTVAVEDTGEGISEENLHRIIQPFFTTKKGDSNFGLGLSYCYNVMQKHEGLLEIESKKGVGTTIFLKFLCNKENIVVQGVKKIRNYVIKR